MLTTNRGTKVPKARSKMFLSAAGLLSLSLGLTGVATVASASPSQEVAAAKKFVAPFLKVPTTIGVKIPLNTTPPKNKLFIFFECDVSQCAVENKSLAKATALFHWRYKAITYQDANPATLVAAMAQGLQMKPAAVAVSGIPEVLWATQYAAYKAARVPIITGYEGPETNKFPIIGNIGGPSDIGKFGTIVANWLIADSNATANVLSVGVSSYPILQVGNDKFASTLAAGCQACKLTALDLTIPEIMSGAINSTIVTALQRDPTIKYVYMCDGAFADGLTSALDAAGLSSIQVIGQAADTTIETAIKAGTNVKAFTALALNYGSYLMVDLAARWMEHMKIPSSADGGLPAQLLVHGGKFTVSESFDQPSNFVAQFKKLWKVK
jgi:ribose transport system substrate-binding protein